MGIPQPNIFPTIKKLDHTQLHEPRSAPMMANQTLSNFVAIADSGIINTRNSSRSLRWVSLGAPCHVRLASSRYKNQSIERYRGAKVADTFSPRKFAVVRQFSANDVFVLQAKEDYVSKYKTFSPTEQRKAFIADRRDTQENCPLQVICNIHPRQCSSNKRTILLPRVWRSQEEHVLPHYAQYTQLQCLIIGMWSCIM